MRRVRHRWAWLLVIAVVSPAAAPDQGLDPLYLAGLTEDLGDDRMTVQAQAIQLYRIPLGLHLRTIEQHRLGLRLTFPISFSSVRLERVSDIGRFVARAWHHWTRSRHRTRDSGGRSTDPESVRRGRVGSEH